MVNYLSGHRDLPPETLAHPCPFGTWLDQGGHALLSDAGINHPVDALHRHIHALADELILAKRNGDTPTVLTGLAELQRLRDELLAQLAVLY